MVSSRLILGAAAVMVMTGCNSTASTPATAKTNAPAASFALPSSNASATVRVQTRNLSMRMANSRVRKYVSAATQGLIATITGRSGNKTMQGFTLEAGAKATTSSPASCTDKATDESFTCTIYFALAPSESPYTATLTTYDSAESGASPSPEADGSDAIALSSDTEAITVVANQSNNIIFTLHGIVQGFDTTPKYIGVATSMAPSPSPISATFAALDGDDYLIGSSTDSTPFFVGPQPSGTFAPEPFVASALDAPKTSADENVAACGSAPCITFATASPSVTDATSEFVSFSYNGTGASGDGKTVRPYYGAVTLSEPAHYSGYTSATLSTQMTTATPYAATAYVVPFFGFADPSSPYTTDPTHVTFAASGDAVTLYAAQFHLPDGSSGYNESDNCGSGSSAIATASAPKTNAGYGANLTLVAGTMSGSCTVMLSDGATPADTALIQVSNSSGSNSLAIVQSASLETANTDTNGDNPEMPTFVLPAPPKVGNVLIASFAYSAYNSLFQEMVGQASALPGWTIALNQTTDQASWNLFAYHVVTASDSESQTPISVPHGLYFVGEIYEVSGAGANPAVSTAGAYSIYRPSVTVSTTSTAANTLAFLVASQDSPGGAPPTATNFTAELTTDYEAEASFFGPSNNLYENGANVTSTVTYPQAGLDNSESAALLLLSADTSNMTANSRAKHSVRQNARAENR